MRAIVDSKHLDQPEGVRSRHPTRQVRRAARSLATTLDSNFFSTEGGVTRDVTHDQFISLSEAADALIELIPMPMPSAEIH